LGSGRKSRLGPRGPAMNRSRGRPLRRIACQIWAEGDGIRRLRQLRPTGATADADEAGPASWPARRRMTTGWYRRFRPNAHSSTARLARWPEEAGCARQRRSAWRP
jgi:hypothetical protein